MAGIVVIAPPAGPRQGAATRWTGPAAIYGTTLMTTSTESRTDSGVEALRPTTRSRAVRLPERDPEVAGIVTIFSPHSVSWPDREAAAGPRKAALTPPWREPATGSIRRRPRLRRRRTGRELSSSRPTAADASSGYLGDRDARGCRTWDARPGRWRKRREALQSPKNASASTTLPRVLESTGCDASSRRTASARRSCSPSASAASPGG